MAPLLAFSAAALLGLAAAGNDPCVVPKPPAPAPVPPPPPLSPKTYKNSVHLDTKGDVVMRYVRARESKACVVPAYPQATQLGYAWRGWAKLAEIRR